MSGSERATGTVTTGELTVADVMHGDVTTLSLTVTVRDVIEWFAGGRRRRLALIADGERYVGALTAVDVGRGLSADWPAADLARYGRTVSPEMTAAEGREEVMQTAARRVPVVDGKGRLCGVLALTTDARRFSCRDGA